MGNLRNLNVGLINKFNNLNKDSVFRKNPI